MRKIAGQPLSAAIRDAKTLEQRLALVPAVIRAAHTLGFAHERGVVHRDVKPDNIVLGAHGETVILDWEIAKVRGLMDEHGPDSPLANVATAGEGTVAGAVLGTPSYMAPEQAQGNVDAIDPRTDVFSLGAALYETLTGRPLYREATVMLTLSAAGMTRFEPIDRLAPEVPWRVELNLYGNYRASRNPRWLERSRPTRSRARRSRASPGHGDHRRAGRPRLARATLTRPRTHSGLRRGPARTRRTGPLLPPRLRTHSRRRGRARRETPRPLLLGRLRQQRLSLDTEVRHGDGAQNVSA